VLVGFVDEDPVRMGPVMDDVAKRLFEHCGGIEAIAPVFVGTFRWPKLDSDSPEVRRRFVTEVLDAHRDSVRIAHGECDGLTGIYGARMRFSCVAIPEYSAILRKLLDLPFGTAVEIPSTSYKLDTTKTNRDPKDRYPID